MNTNINSKVSNIIIENEISANASQHGTKRAAPSELEGSPKKVKIDYHSSGSNINIPSFNSKPIEQSNFIVKTETFVDASKNIQLIEEIPDDELVAMAIQFDLEHPQ